MRSLLEIITFFTPLDERWAMEQKEKAISDMIVLALENAWEGFEKNSKTDTKYTLTQYTLEGIKIEISIKNDSEMNNYYLPHLLLNVSINESKFLQENIEAFLNTITRFFSGMYKQDYFVTHDTKYRLIDMNSGKKYSIDDIGDIDTESITSKKNKNLLDSLLYLHYTLSVRIQDFAKLEEEIHTIEESSKESAGSILLKNIRKEEVQISLVKNKNLLQSQIEIVLQYFT